MAETERPHRSSSINSSNNKNASSSDFFICFTSRFSSSSSMRLSSKSIHSPARSACLTTSLSRRLRTSGSFKNASSGVFNSPMFGATGRKRSGSGYGNDSNTNNIEPSSPKVTCIGQVRVKTRKHVKKKMRARSRRKGDTSFRRSSELNDGLGGGGGGCRFDASENRWVHLPVTICESLRAFGSELNCFFPCRSSCTANGHRDRRPVENSDGCCRGNSCGGGNYCGGVFTRWFVAVEETGGKRREIELVVGGDDNEEEDRRRSRRRHVFEELDISAMETKTEKKENEEVGRRSICSPPKNALLLMRCRSDPVKVAALANRVRERQMSLNDCAQGGGEEEEEEEEEERRRIELEMEDKKRIELCEKWISGETTVEREVPVSEAEAQLASNPAREEEEAVEVLEDSIVEAAEDEASKIQEVDSFEKEFEATIMKNIEDDIRNAIEEEEQMAEMEDLAAVAGAEEKEEEESREIVASVTQNEERSEQGNREPDPSPELVMRGSQQEETIEKEKTTATPYKVLPDCLLLMMCEPKLSMEVSKETWVCSTDFVRCLPGRPPAKKIPETAGDHHQPKKRIATVADSNASSRRRSIDKPPLHQALLQPPRSSCSYPAAPPIIAPAAALGEQKIAGANKASEPPVLPRCKSEPRKSASKLAPEACFWKNRKLEPHHPPASVGVGAAGIGF